MFCQFHQVCCNRSGKRLDTLLICSPSVFNDTVFSNPSTWILRLTSSKARVLRAARPDFPADWPLRRHEGFQRACGFRTPRENALPWFITGRLRQRRQGGATGARNRCRGHFYIVKAFLRLILTVSAVFAKRQCRKKQARICVTDEHHFRWDR
ncbi:MAG: hypothetical protein CMJ81_04150 [Planctomycetaceae bacterium]|nr:hypothetical protein [Planctomycetaceae bacterium]MBP62757.1 hypothetical protein [Planctomycetaceae bacterium]